MDAGLRGHCRAWVAATCVSESTERRVRAGRCSISNGEAPASLGQARDCQPSGSLSNDWSIDDARPIVSVVAPAGYGKTTLLSQWAERSTQAVAWVSVDEADNDPKVLLTYVAEALDAIEPIGERVFDALASPASSVPGSVVPRLGSAFASMTSPVTLVLDDVHLLHNSECRAALSVLADHVPAGSRLVLAGRAEPPLRTARLRAEGRMLEIGPGELSLTAARRHRCCAPPRWCWATMTWPSCISGLRDGRPGCTSRHCTCAKAGRCRARRPRSAGMTCWSASTWSRSS